MNRFMLNLSEPEIATILADAMLGDLKVVANYEYCRVFHEKRPELVITKYVYLEHNKVFNVNKQDIEPKCRCEFHMHTGCKSSYVVVFNRHDKEMFNGNWLWRHHSCDNADDYMLAIRLLHSVQDVKDNFCLR